MTKIINWLSGATEVVPLQSDGEAQINM